MSEIESNDKIRLRHMLDSAHEIQLFIADKTRKSLDNERILTLALVKSIEIIGEAASKINKEFQQAHPQIPWPAIIGMRNRLIHAYVDVDLDRLWQTSTVAIPPLITELEKILSSTDEA